MTLGLLGRMVPKKGHGYCDLCGPIRVVVG